MRSPSNAVLTYFLVFAVLLTWHQGARAIRCFARLQCKGNFLTSVSTPRDCCVGSSVGVTYDSSGENEPCHICEVMGWKEAVVYVLQNSNATLVFGAVKGQPGIQYIVNVNYTTNDAGLAVQDTTQLGRILLGADDVTVGVTVPQYNSSERYAQRNSTLRMVRQLPVSLGSAKFFHPEEVTLHVVVPRLEFATSDYTVQYPELSVPVCLAYNNTPGHAQFDVEVSLFSRNGSFSETNTFSFTRSSGRSCLPLSLPPSLINPFTDTLFIATIDISRYGGEQPPFDIGPIKTATITVNSLKVPQVQFEVNETSYTHPVAAVSSCLERTMPDGAENTYTALSVNVRLNVRGSEQRSSLMNFEFGENQLKSCQNITVSPDSDCIIRLEILRPEEPLFSVGQWSATVITVEREEREEGTTVGSGDLVTVAAAGVPGPGSNDQAPLSRDTSSGPDSWVIGLAVALPVTVILAIATVAIVAAAVYAWNKRKSPPSQSLDTKS